MNGFPFEIISASSSVTKAYAIDNSIIKTRNVDSIPPMEIALHSHPYYSIVYVDDCDTFTTYIDGAPITHLPGHAYFNPPGTLHSPKNQFGGMFSSVGLKFYIKDISLAEKLGALPFYVSCDDKLTSLFLDSIRLSKCFDVMVLPALYENTMKILTALIDTQKNIISAKPDIYDLNFIKVIKHMYKYCDRDIDLEELSEIAHMERTSFARKFKSMYKITPINYLYSIRLSLSLDLLMTYDNLPITSIAQMVGFKRATAFTTAFARTFGMTPTEYREELSSRKIPLVIYKRD